MVTDAVVFTRADLPPSYKNLQRHEIKPYMFRNSPDIYHIERLSSVLFLDNDGKVKVLKDRRCVFMYTKTAVIGE